MWQRIATELRVTAEGYRNRANDFTVRLPERLADGDVTFAAGDAWLSFSLRGAGGVAEVSGNRARYEGVLPGVDAVYTSQEAGLKEDLILRSRRSTRSFTFDLRLRRGLRPRREDTGAVDIVNRRGNVRLRLAGPVMIDAAGAQSDRVDVRLARLQAGWALTLVPDRRWLDDPQRRWPVVIDPVVTRGAERDCHFDDDGNTACSNPTLFVGYVFHPALPDSDLQYHGLLRFDVASAVPPGAHIIDARWRSTGTEGRASHPRSRRTRC